MGFTSVNEFHFTLRAVLMCNPQVLKRLVTNLGSRMGLTAGFGKKNKKRRKKIPAKKGLLMLQIPVLPTTEEI